MKMLRPLFLLLTFCLVSAAMADINWTFDQPYFVEEYGVKTKDHALLYHEGLYHLFYIQGFEGGTLPGYRLEQWLGHVTSEDLRTWTRQDSILPVVPGTWEEGFIWAPDILENPSGPGWVMFYTGAEYNSEARQRMGVAYSEDLYTWTREPANPVYEPDTWTDWAVPVFDSANCRDPELFQIPGYPGWHLINSVRTSEGNGALALAYSEDFINWTQQDTLFYHGSPNMLESANLYVDTSDRKHMFYTEYNHGGTSHMSSGNYLGGWNKDNAVNFDAGEGPEVSQLNGKIIFSRYSADYPVDLERYYIEFDYLDAAILDPPDMIKLEGLQDHWHIRFGEAFDYQPTFGDNPIVRGRPSTNMEGNSYLATSEKYMSPHGPGAIGQQTGLAPTGLLESDPFSVQRDRFSMLIGGGNMPEHCFIAMVRVSDGRIMLREMGPDAWEMERRIWDTSTLVGEEVFIAVADLASYSSGSMWGWISVDSIREYPFTGSDEVTPSTPLVEDLYLARIVEDAGFDYPATQTSDFSKLRKLFR